MKINKYRGFVWLPILIVLGLIVAGAAVGGGLYWFEQQTTPSPTPVVQLATTTPVAQSTSNTSASTQTTTPASQSISIPGMSQYTDSSFGFSFWYPSGWTVTVSDGCDPNMLVGSLNHSAVKTLDIGDATYYIDLCEITSTDGVYYEAGKIYDQYYYDATTGLWMYNRHWDPQTGLGNHISPADLSDKTMGGLPIFAGQYVALSGNKFLNFEINSEPNNSIDLSYFLNTIVATDPSVATPVSATQQEATIEAEQQAYAGQ